MKVLNFEFELRFEFCLPAIACLFALVLALAGSVGGLFEFN